MASLKVFFLLKFLWKLRQVEIETKLLEVITIPSSDFYLSVLWEYTMSNYLHKFGFLLGFVIQSF